MQITYSGPSPEVLLLAMAEDRTVCVTCSNNGSANWNTEFRPRALIKGRFERDAHKFGGLDLIGTIEGEIRDADGRRFRIENDCELNVFLFEPEFREGMTEINPDDLEEI